MRIYNFILINLITLNLFAQTTTPVPSIKVADILAHNTEKSCWVVIHNKVYDVTKFLKDHPAPYKVMVKYCGKDASAVYDNKAGLGEKHSDKSTKIADKLFIGNLAQ